jgi:DNA-binding IclR family transcriptional regulator
MLKVGLLGRVAVRAIVGDRLHVHSHTAVRVGSRLGAIMHAHCTSGGKALLAQLPPDEVSRRYCDTSPAGMTDKSIDTLAALHAELKRTAKLGYATNIGESEPVVSGVAVAVDGFEPLALAVSVASSRLTCARVSEVVADIRETARLPAPRRPSVSLPRSRPARARDSGAGQPGQKFRTSASVPGYQGREQRPSTN